ncbi:hypothetical protein V5799_027348 [Amblyomma americanum]|uniref:Carboxypeptidase n=1 Tax=Amblyomma americanum TaxID=6943 RepID=A0AAQ4DG00_AMBAM
MITKLLLATWALPLFATASDPSEWAVADLPGLQEPINFKHYSGYLNIANGGALHFWFMESQRSPSEDPVILWLSGGPGCSSLIAAVAEQGAFRVGYQGINMTVNPYSWNKVANIIFLESPVGVGFSYDLSDNYTTNDTKTTHDNYLAVLKFFDNFENFRQNDFYIMGESYAGVYVPLLVKRVLQDPHGINLKGYAIGNGAMDEQLIGNSIVFFAYYHGLVSSSSDMTYNQQYPTMREVVQELAETGGLKALIYNGDVDMACNFLGDEWFVRSLGYEPTSEYRMWRVGSVIAGFVQEYEKNITFVTVKLNEIRPVEMQIMEYILFRPDLMFSSTALM